jgi:hypothetical protein
MGKHVLYGDITSSAKQPYLKQTHAHYNDMIDELTKAFGETIVSDSSSVTILWGCVNTGTGTGIGNSAIISAGAVYYNGEIYQVPAFSTASIVNGLKGTITTTYPIIDPITFSDSTSHYVHQIKTIVISDAVSAGIFNFNNWYSIKNEWKSYTLTNSDVASSSGTFTVLGASTKNLKYKIDYKNQIITLNFNIEGADHAGASTNNAFYIKLPESLTVSSAYTNMGYFLNTYLTTTEASGSVKEIATRIYTAGGYGSNQYLTVIPSRSSFTSFDTDGSNNIYLYGQITFGFGA